MMLRLPRLLVRPLVSFLCVLRFQLCYAPQSFISLCYHFSEILFVRHLTHTEQDKRPLPNRSPGLQGSIGDRLCGLPMDVADAPYSKLVVSQLKY